ncbi:glycoside hydrolase family 3 protein [Mumia sp. zg.B53]|uniref:glycoside hydrolase family 3 protein n=1 Tax=Mumia sp. zg.B53 TaxID=2855449 RepID=UPI001C6E8E50|nr:glycoside hydrolase family 3 protein [Mumia sp. zg.B53]MBW9216179.1 glycoside hydrolase family 3 protein [Mumia sp. zg.B53]
MSARSTSTTRHVRTPLRLLAIGLSLALVAAFGPPAATASGPGHSGDAPYRGKVISQLRHMTLEQKVGQLFVIEVAGRDADNPSDAAKAINRRMYGVDTPAQAVAKYQPGGVIYYTTRNNDENIGDPAQVATLSNGLQRAALSLPSRIPLQISVDQEGGALVARFGPPATQMPGNMALGAGRSTRDARRSAEVIGTELDAVGVTQDYAPVADVNVNPNNPVIGIRSIGSDPGLVSRLVAAQVRGYRAGGVSAVAKHFPGHGDTAKDSHFGLPEVTHDRAELEAIDLPPFRAAIDAGIESIMTAHIVLPAIDPGVPATMSHKILTGLLREELGFDGLIVTDALDMQGATATYPPDVAPVRAFLAGADQLLVPPQMDTAYNAVLDAVRSGEISKQRLDESVYRILLHKHRRGIFGDPYVDPVAATHVVGAPEHVADAQAITDRTTTLVKNDDALLPLTAGPRRVLVAGWGVGTTQTIANAVAARGATPQVLESGTTPTAAAIANAVTAARASDLVVVTTNNAYGFNPDTGQPTAAAVAQTALVRALLATGTPVVAVAVRNPYDVASFPAAPTVLDTYGYTAHQMDSLVRVMFGELEPTGKLPVSIPRADGTGDLFPFGHGLGY